MSIDAWLQGPDDPETRGHSGLCMAVAGLALIVAVVACNVLYQVFLHWRPQ